MVEKSRQAEDYYVPLIHGLPDDLALLCLARVPRRFNHVLRCVSRRWRALLSSVEWHSCGQKNNLEEAWIYVMRKDSHGKNFFYVLDSERHNWKRLQPISPACLKRQGMYFEAVGNKTVVVGRKIARMMFTDMILLRRSGKKLLKCQLLGDSFCQQLWATKSTLQPAWARALDMASNAGVVLVVSSFAPHLGNSFDVVGCKTIGI